MKSLLESFHTHKLFYLLGGVLLFIIILLVTFYLVGDKEKTNLANIEKGEPASLEELYDQDSDNDGIADWEEFLLGYNPLDADSNDDGVTDGQSLTLVRESLEEYSIEQGFQPTPYVPFDELPLSDRIARETYTTTSVLESLGELTPEKEQLLVDDIYDQLITGDGYFLYSELDFKLPIIADIESQGQYMQEVLSILEEFSVDSPNPIIVLDNAIKKEDPTLVEQGLIIPIEKNQEQLEKLLSIPVYPTYTQQQIIVVNTISKLIKDSQDIQQYFQDPLLGYSATVKMKVNGSEYAKSFEELTLQIQQDSQEIINSLN